MKESFFKFFLTLHLVTIAFFFRVSNLESQNLVFSQYQLSQSVLNPALTGNSQGARFSLHYRNEWPSIPNAYITSKADYSQFIPSLRTGFGAYVYQDQLGDGIYKNTHFGLSANYLIQFSDDFNTRFGLGISGTQTRLDWNKLRFFDQIDERNGFESLAGLQNSTLEDPQGFNLFYGTLSLGTVLIYKNTYAAFSLLNANQPNEARLIESADLPSLFFAEIKHVYEIDKVTDLDFGLLMAHQNEFNQLQLHSGIEYKNLIGRLGARHTFTNFDALIVAVGYKKDIFKAIYSYDITLSELSGQTGGSHEIAIVIDFAESPSLKRRRNAKMYNNCLEIFR